MFQHGYPAFLDARIDLPEGTEFECSPSRQGLVKHNDTGRFTSGCRMTVMWAAPPIGSVTKPLRLAPVYGLTFMDHVDKNPRVFRVGKRE